MLLPVMLFKKIYCFLIAHSYFVVKILRAVITTFIILVLSFFMVRASGNPAEIYLGDNATPKMVEYFNKKWGLDEPLYVQFLTYFSSVISGDMGDSLIKNRPVSEIITERIPATLSLMVPAAAISMFLGIILGMIAALHHKKITDGGILLASIIGFSLPNFFFGVILIYFFSVVLGLLPSSGNDSFRHYIMPLIAIITADVAVFTRFTRAALIDIFEKHYITNFRALGIKEKRILFLQALPNASIALLTISGFYIGSLVAGAIVTETIFSWPGLGSLLIASVKARDMPLVQGLILLFGISIVAANLIIDFLYGVIDPRIRKRAS
ncbi:MAG TPA: ABC transporter permease [Spirochaeta sp.]|nr:ABC transporter permease [Spirochaeta sp.]